MKKFVSVILSLLMVLSMTACGSSASDAPAASAAPTAASSVVLSGVEDGVLTVGMECAYAPYNWTQMDDSNGAVPIANNPGAYANGYDVMIAKKICEANGWELEIMAIGWDGLVPALNAGQLDAVIAGQSMTETRLQEVDMAGPYFYASIVCVTRKDSPLASATGISQLSGSCTAQTGTIWYDTCLPQIAGAAADARFRNGSGHGHGRHLRHCGLHLHRYAHRYGRLRHLRQSGDSGLLRQRGQFSGRRR